MDQAICTENCRRLNELEKSVAEETARNAAEHASYKRRISELEDASKQQNAILVTLQRQADAIETMNEKIDGVTNAVGDMSARIEVIEKEPADKWKKISFEIIKYIVIGAAGIVAGMVINGVGL